MTLTSQKTLKSRRGYIILKWEGDDLVADNTHTWKEDKDVYGYGMLV